jgi:glycosyltransferase involved in cell wall biosynthesis
MGGGPTAVAHHVRAFAGRFDLCVFHGAHGLIAETCQAAGVPHVRLPLDRIWMWPVGVPRLWAALARYRPDVLILHGQWTAAPGALAGRLAGIRRIVYIVHWVAFSTDWDLLRTVRNFLSEWIPCRLADRVVVLSASSRYRYLAHGWPDPARLITLTNPLDLGAVASPQRAAAIRRELGWDEQSCHVAYVGRLNDQKHMDWLLKSWRLVQERAAEARLWIIGDGEQRAGLERLAAELNLGRTCRFLGAKPCGIEFFGAADLAVATSMGEACPYTVAEAMASGKPVVASDVDGIRDALRDGEEGFLVPPGDIEGFADRLLTLIRDPALRDAMGRKGRVAARRYAAEAVMPQYERLLLELTAEPRR